MGSNWRASAAVLVGCWLLGCGSVSDKPLFDSSGGSPAAGGSHSASGGVAGGMSFGGSATINGGTAGGGTSSTAAGGSNQTPGGASSHGGAAGMGSGGGPTVPATCQGQFPTVALDGAPFSVSVDRSNSHGQLPHFWSSYGIGHLALFLQQESNWGEILKAHVLDGVKNLGLNSIRAHGLFHDDLGIYREENGTPVYDFSRSDQVFDFLTQNGVFPIVELSSMPAALARDPSQVWALWKMGISPPKDFKRWQDLIFQFVDHSVKRYGADVVRKWYFEVWNEPECCHGKFWTGTLDEYFELYDYTVAGVIAALPDGRVGGPVSSQPAELATAGKQFLQHVTTDNYLKPGTPGRLDTFMYHSWNFIDASVNGYFSALELLHSFNLDNVGVAITEFGPTWEFNLKDEPQEMDQGAAFAAQTYADIAQRCVRENKRFPITYAWWTLSDVFKEEEYRNDEPFIGAMGLISRENLHKPAYNTYKFLARMGNELVDLSTKEQTGVGGMAARDANGGVQVLIYNGQSPGKGPADDKYYTNAAAQDIAVTVSGLDPKLAYDVTAYRVDDTHGNAYSIWKTLGRPKTAALTEANWSSLRDAMDSKAEPMAQSQCGSSYSGRFPLTSPGVLFVQLTPTPGKLAAP